MSFGVLEKTARTALFASKTFFKQRKTCYWVPVYIQHEDSSVLLEMLRRELYEKIARNSTRRLNFSSQPEVAMVWDVGKFLSPFYHREKCEIFSPCALWKWSRNAFIRRDFEKPLSPYCFFYEKKTLAA